MGEGVRQAGEIGQETGIGQESKIRQESRIGQEGKIGQEDGMRQVSGVERDCGAEQAGWADGGGPELAERIEALFGLDVKDIRSYSPLTLAYIGDSIYDLVVRTMLVGRGNAPVNSLHRRASSLVKAEAQKASLYRIEPELTEEEKAFYRRGRNAKSYTSAKNASVTDYRIATGFEALMGYLYLTGRTERLLYLSRRGLEEDKAEELSEPAAGAKRDTAGKSKSQTEADKARMERDEAEGCAQAPCGKEESDGKGRIDD